VCLSPGRGDRNPSIAPFGAPTETEEPFCGRFADPRLTPWAIAYRAFGTQVQALASVAPATKNRHTPGSRTPGLSRARPSAAVCRLGSSPGLPASGGSHVPGSLFRVPCSRPLAVPGPWPMTTDKGRMTVVPHSALVTPFPALLYSHGCPQVSCFPFPVPVPGSPFPVPAFSLGTGVPRFPSPHSLAFIVYLSTAPKVIHNGVWQCVHVKNHQIRVKIDQKGDVYRQKAIKKARISSCPS